MAINAYIPGRMQWNNSCILHRKDMAFPHITCVLQSGWLNSAAQEIGLANDDSALDQGKVSTGEVLGILYFTSLILEKHKTERIIPVCLD